MMVRHDGSHMLIVLGPGACPQQEADGPSLQGLRGTRATMRTLSLACRDPWLQLITFSFLFLACSQQQTQSAGAASSAPLMVRDSALYHIPPWKETERADFGVVLSNSTSTLTYTRMCYTPRGPGDCACTKQLRRQRGCTGCYSVLSKAPLLTPLSDSQKE